jgi:hypothetical protein
MSIMVHTNATNLTTNSSDNVSSRNKLYAKNARLNKKNDEFVVNVALVCTRPPGADWLPKFWWDFFSRGP